MIIKLNDKYRLASDAYNWIVQQEGGNDWVCLTYWSTLWGAVTELRTRDFASGVDLEAVADAVLSLATAKKEIARLLPADRGACDCASFRHDALPGIPNELEALVIERGAHEWWVQFDWVRKLPKERTLPIVWQYVLGRPDVAQRGQGAVGSYLRQPQYFRCLGAALIAYLERRFREGDCPAEATEIGQFALAAVAAALKRTSRSSSKPRLDPIAAGVGAEHQPAPQSA